MWYADCMEMDGGGAMGLQGCRQSVRLDQDRKRAKTGEQVGETRGLCGSPLSLLQRSPVLSTQPFVRPLRNHQRSIFNATRNFTLAAH